jgi:NAD(P)-dependent dehydrogenase (short-subunit alcohol dehydrogenase family)
MVVVTGANSGLGFYTTRALAAKSARVIMACRNTAKGEDARKEILKDDPGAQLEVWKLDLADLKSVDAFIQRYFSNFDRLDIQINNAGLMAVPFGRTRDGFEMQFGVNHLGHFALSAGLWPLLSSTGGSRLVSVSSAAHHIGKIRFEDIHWEIKYSKWGAYGMSKLANLLFIKALSRKISQAGSKVVAAAAHPGYASTDLQAKGYLMSGARVRAASFNFINRLVAQSAAMGALPTLYAATAEHVEPGSYYGPARFWHMRGYPAPDLPNSKKVTDQVAARLWDLSESLTGKQFSIA